MKCTTLLIAGCYAFELGFKTTGWILSSLCALFFLANFAEHELKKRGHL